MPTPLLDTKRYRPAPRPQLVARPRLIARLNEGLSRRLTLVSAPAGFGKTTLLSAWLAAYARPAAWLSLDAGDSDPARFLAYVIAALQTIAPELGTGILAALQSPRPPPADAILTPLLNAIAALPQRCILVLDDYHTLDSRPVDQALATIVERLPHQLHLVIATREDPPLPLARLRARDQLTELRAADLRFTAAEAAELLNRVMGLRLTADDVATLEARTEGWVVGLQLAAISLQGHPNPAGFIASFTGSHHFVLDYLLEEVLQQQQPPVQAFLLSTSILERLCGPLCEAVLGAPAGFGQATLEQLERANLFLVPLDDQRLWYRYHHLFGDLLRKRLEQTTPREAIAGLHSRAGAWHEQHGLLAEGWRHAVAADDLERAERLVEHKAMPLHARGVSTAVLEWLAALPPAVLDARPGLWVKSATLALLAGQTTGVEERLQAAECALSAGSGAERSGDLIGKIACARATLALTRYDPETMIAQSRHALAHLRPDDLPFRFTATWTLASACLLQGDRATAAQALQESIAISRLSGDVFSTILAASSLGEVQELDTRLHEADATYRSILPLLGEHPQPNAGEVYLGLARICYEWNDLAGAEAHGRRGLELMRQYDRAIDRFVLGELLMARLRLAQGDLDGASALLAQSEQSARRQEFRLRLPEIAAAQVPVLLRQGHLAAADRLVQQYQLPLCRARVLIAQGDPAAALAVLEPFRRQAEARGWADESLKALALQAVAHHAHGATAPATEALVEALARAEPGGYVRLFLDEGAPMAELLRTIHGRGGSAGAYARRLVAAHGAEPAHPAAARPQPLPEPLSRRELEVLRLVAEGHSNQAIAERLGLALDTVKGHNRRIFGKLEVRRRTEAIARARALGLL